MSIRFVLIMIVAVFALTFEALAFDDYDGDGVEDTLDNCTDAANSGQEDSDGDGYGNACDADLDNSGWVDGTDFNIYSECQNRPGEGARSGCFIADFNSDNRVNSLDFMLFEVMWAREPGPSGTQ